MALTRLNGTNFKGSPIDARIAEDEDVPLFYEQFSPTKDSTGGGSGTRPPTASVFESKTNDTTSSASTLSTLDSVLNSLVVPSASSSASAFGNLWPAAPSHATSGQEPWSRQDGEKRGAAVSSGGGGGGLFGSS